MFPDRLCACFLHIEEFVLREHLYECCQNAIIASVRKISLMEKRIQRYALCTQHMRWSCVTHWRHVRVYPAPCSPTIILSQIKDLIYAFETLDSHGMRCCVWWPVPIYLWVMHAPAVITLSVAYVVAIIE